MRDYFCFCVLVIYSVDSEDQEDLSETGYVYKAKMEKQVCATVTRVIFRVQCSNYIDTCDICVNCGKLANLVGQ